MSYARRVDSTHREVIDTRQCLVCKVEFTPIPSEVRRDRGHCCSKLCANRLNASKCRILTPVTDRRCYKCRVIKPIDEFHVSRGCLAGKGYVCKSCSAQIAKETHAMRMDGVRRRRFAAASHISTCKRCGAKTTAKRELCGTCIRTQPRIEIPCRRCGEVSRVIQSKQGQKYCSRSCADSAQSEREMGRRGARKDANHNDIAEALAAIGCLVMDTSAMGRGFPDILISPPHNRHDLMLLEIKTKTGRLNPAQIAFHRQWDGATYVVRSVDEAIELIRSRARKSAERAAANQVGAQTPRES